MAGILRGTDSGLRGGGSEERGRCPNPLRALWVAPGGVHSPPPPGSFILFAMRKAVPVAVSSSGLGRRGPGPLCLPTVGVPSPEGSGQTWSWMWPPPRKQLTLSSCPHSQAAGPGRGGAQSGAEAAKRVWHCPEGPGCWEEGGSGSPQPPRATCGDPLSYVRPTLGPPPGPGARRGVADTRHHPAGSGSSTTEGWGLRGPWQPGAEGRCNEKCWGPWGGRGHAECGAEPRG